MNLWLRQAGTEILWLLGAYLIFFQLSWASPQTVNTVVADGTAKTAKAMERRPSWLPPDVDEEVPPVEKTNACSLDEVTAPQVAATPGAPGGFGGRWV
jgi:hypothetical protein